MKLLTEQAEVAFGEGEEAKPCGSSVLRHSSDGLAVSLCGHPAEIADRDLSSPRSDQECDWRILRLGANRAPSDPERPDAPHRQQTGKLSFAPRRAGPIVESDVQPCLLSLLRQILAMTDHDQPLPRVAHTNTARPSEAAHRTRIAAGPCLLGFADSQLCLSGQYLSGPMATPMRRSGSEDLTQ